MRITKKYSKKNPAPYYYLVHSVRIQGKIKKYEKYLGKEVPQNLDQLEDDLFRVIRQDKFNEKLKTIKKHYLEKISSYPRSAFEKEVDNFIIEFTFNTQKIEGSTLTFRETSLLLDKGITPSNKPIDDVIEAELHKKLISLTIQDKPAIILDTILQWHYILFSLTKSDIAGKIRTHGVKIPGSKFVPPSPVEIQPMLDELILWFNNNKKDTEPVELAGFMHLKFVTIHPFADGNGRLSRLIMNSILIEHNLPMIDIKYKNRSSYYKALEKSQTSEKEHYFLDWFLSYYCNNNL